MKKYLLTRLNWRLSARISFIFLGLASTIWFLIRIIPKPSRAAYPCMRAAAPLMSAFVLYLISISASVLAFRSARTLLYNKKYATAVGFIAACIAAVFISGVVNNQVSSASQLVSGDKFVANDPIGTPRGIHPGRVVWVWDRNATDSLCTNTTNDYWFQNTDAEEVDSMLQTGIKQLAGVEDITAAWDSIFRYFNSNHGKDYTGYTAGEKVYVKINITNSCCSVTGTTKVSDFHRMDATPELCLALLRQLIEVVGVAQSDIYLGDPFRTFHNLYWDMCHSVYPDVNYCDGQGINGRYKTVATDTNVIKFSNGVHAVRIPREYMEAAYFINMSCLKTHNEGAITLTAKNHQGSILEQGTAVENQSAMIMHPYLPANDEGNPKYRHLVDYMGHNKLGGNTLIFIVDGIWAGRSWEGYVEKWQMVPFNNDYPSSLFLSQDEVAVQSVCFDFLLEEYRNKPEAQKYPYISGTDDFLLQAADPSNWPAGIEYDPEGDGTVIGSLGVHEHWNNATDKQYSRNLSEDYGIELVSVVTGSSENIPDGLNDMPEHHEITLHTYPNPASDEIFFEYTLSGPERVLAEVYSLNGIRIALLKDDEEVSGNHTISWQVSNIPAGEYIVRLKVLNETGYLISSGKFTVR